MNLSGFISISQDIHFKRASAEDSDWAFNLKVAAEKDTIRSVFGWDFELQKMLHQEEWSKHKPTKIFYRGTAVGTFLLNRSDAEYLFGRFFIFPEFQGLGIGSRVMEYVVKKIDDRKAECRLYYLLGNRVGRLYERYGFKEERRDHAFVYMRRQKRGRATIQ